jgi:hypothetical protein
VVAVWVVTVTVVAVVAVVAVVDDASVVDTSVYL